MIQGHWLTSFRVERKHLAAVVRIDDQGVNAAAT